MQEDMSLDAHTMPLELVSIHKGPSLACKHVPDTEDPESPLAV